MKHFLFAVSFLLLADLLLLNCANPKSPTGGPKDTIPPTLINSQPVDQSLNFDAETITLTFDEFVNADKLKPNLIITPTTEIKFKTIVKKNVATIKFESDLDDSTTYTFNFFDGITDITERNPAENLILAFSTGDYIDSLEVFGVVRDLFTGKPMAKVTVGLYRNTDTLDVKKVKPTYFSSTDENGAFHLRNIKNNQYRLLAFNDANKNLLFDPASEAHGFLSDTLRLKESIPDSITLNMVKIDASELELISARPTGRYFEVRYTKPIVKFNIETGNDQYLPAQISGESKNIKFYDNFSITDSLKTRVTVFDSLGNQRTDTLFVKFRESSRKLDEFKTTLFPKPNSSVFPDSKYKLDFNKPISILDSNFVQVPIDTFYTFSLQPENLEFNYDRTELIFSLPITQRALLDSTSILKTKYPVDSTNLDSLNLFILQKLNSMEFNNFTIIIKNEAFISADEDTTSQFIQTFRFGKSENYGLVRVTINTSVASYTVQLMKADKPVAQIKDCKTCLFNRIPPGDYWVRVLLDTNQDEKWSVGNILKLEEPEPVVFFPEATSLRANWEVELNYSF